MSMQTMILRREVIDVRIRTVHELMHASHCDKKKHCAHVGITAIGKTPHFVYNGSTAQKEAEQVFKERRNSSSF